MTEPLPRSTSARHALLAFAAEDMFDVAHPELCPPAHALFGELGWTLRGYLTAVDEITGIGVRAFYGVLLEGSTWGYALVVRGTESMIEWLKDAEFALTPHPVAGRVESGFWSIYSTMRFRTPEGAVQPLLPGILAAMGAGELTIIGHSLGAPIATYLHLDLEATPSTGLNISGRFFASPRPGDSDFATHASAALTDHCVYAYEEDLVPKVPLGFGYSELANLVTLPKSAEIESKNPASWHHATTYGYLLDSTVLPLIPSGPFRSSILVP